MALGVVDQDEAEVRPLLAILSCAADARLEAAQRATFLAGSPMEHRFFRGAGAGSGPDAVELPVPDSFEDLPFKSQAAARWALENGYDALFKCDTDTYVRPERLLPGPGAWDYSGYFTYDEGPGAYASGGSGYWLSRRAMEVVAASDAFFRDPLRPPGESERSTRGEDLQVCWVLQGAGIHCRKDGRYRLRRPGPARANDYATLHDVLAPLKFGDGMARAHWEWATS